MAEHQRYRLDDLRRLGVDLAVGLGVAPARASAFVSGLLWYEAADASEFGIASLPEWLVAIERGEIDPIAEGKILKEHTATALLDGQNGLGPLILARAAGVAQEKAREVGAAIVRVVNLGRVRSGASVAAEIAIGPMIGTVVGPRRRAVAVPVEGSVPTVFDTALAPGDGPEVPPWADPRGNCWGVFAQAVSAFESLASLHEHIGALLESSPPIPGEVRPDAWQARRLEHLEHGLTLEDPSVEVLRAWAERLGVAWPESA